MAERNTQAKNTLEFGTASMYVISERGLQTESLTPSKAAKSTVFLDKTVFSGKKVNLSRTRAIDFSWEKVTDEPDQADNKIRILDLNELAVDDNIKKPVCPERTRSFAGAKFKNQLKLLNRPYVCLQASRVNDMKQVGNDGNPSVSRLTTICHLSLDGSKKDTNEDFEEKAKKEPEKCTERCSVGEMKLPHAHYLDSLTCEQTLRNSKDLKDVTSGSEKQDGGSGNSGSLQDNIFLEGKNPDRPGKCYLKRIFYPKGNNYLKSNNPGCLPQISAKSENNFIAINPEKLAKTDSPNTETTQQGNSANTRESNKLLLPLNVNVLKNSEKQKHHLKSIVKLPTVVDKRTGQVHLSLEAVAFEQSDYNKWSRRQKRIKTENGKISCVSFPLITESGKWN